MFYSCGSIKLRSWPMLFTAGWCGAARVQVAMISLAAPSSRLLAASPRNRVHSSARYFADGCTAALSNGARRKARAKHLDVFARSGLRPAGSGGDTPEPEKTLQAAPQRAHSCMLFYHGHFFLTYSYVGAFSNRSPPGKTKTADPIAEATLRWIRSIVVRLNLCPWAGGALAGGHVRVIVYPSDCLDDIGGVALEHPPDQADGPCFGGLTELAAREAVALGALEGDAARNATSLVVARPPLAADYEDFLAAAQAVDDFIDAAGLRGTVQLATFHPKYRFDGSDDSDASNYTNRSPYPVLHLLLEQQVSAAIDQIGRPDTIWEKNVQTTRAIGSEAMRREVEACKKTNARGYGREGSCAAADR